MTRTAQRLRPPAVSAMTAAPRRGSNAPPWAGQVRQSPRAGRMQALIQASFGPAGPPLQRLPGIAANTAVTYLKDGQPMAGVVKAYDELGKRYTLQDDSQVAEPLVFPADQQTGLLKWRLYSNQSNQDYQHWRETGEPPKEMNCWEFLIFWSVQHGLLDRAQLKDADSKDVMTRILEKNARRQVDDFAGLKAGNLISFKLHYLDEPGDFDHVAISLGGAELIHLSQGAPVRSTLTAYLRGIAQERISTYEGLLEGEAKLRKLLNQLANFKALSFLKTLSWGDIEDQIREKSLLYEGFPTDPQFQLDDLQELYDGAGRLAGPSEALQPWRDALIQVGQGRWTAHERLEIQCCPDVRLDQPGKIVL